MCLDYVFAGTLWYGSHHTPAPRWCPWPAGPQRLWLVHSAEYARCVCCQLGWHAPGDQFFASTPCVASAISLNVMLYQPYLLYIISPHFFTSAPNSIPPLTISHNCLEKGNPQELISLEKTTSHILTKPSKTYLPSPPILPSFSSFLLLLLLFSPLLSYTYIVFKWALGSSKGRAMYSKEQTMACKKRWNNHGI